MYPTDQAPFHPLVNATDPSFNTSALVAAALYALESTGTRIWQGPGSRSVRLCVPGSTAYYAKFGTSDVVAASTDSMLVVGPGPEIFEVSPSQSHVSLFSSTNVTVNITLGVGR